MGPKSSKAMTKRSATSHAGERPRPSPLSPEKPSMRRKVSFEVPSCVSFCQDFPDSAAHLRDKQKAAQVLAQELGKMATWVDKSGNTLPVEVIREVENACTTVLKTNTQSRTLCGRALWVLHKLLSFYGPKWEPSAVTRDQTLEKFYRYSKKFLNLSPKRHRVAVKSRRQMQVPVIKLNSLCDVVAFDPNVILVCVTLHVDKNDGKMTEIQRSDAMKKLLRNVRIVKVQTASRTIEVKTRGQITKAIHQEFEYILHVYYDEKAKKLIDILQTCLSILSTLALKGSNAPLYHKTNIMHSMLQGDHAVELLSILKHDIQDTTMQANLFAFLVNCARLNEKKLEFDKVAVSQIRKLTQSVDGVHGFIHDCHKQVGAMGNTLWHTNLNRLMEMIAMTPERIDSFLSSAVHRPLRASEMKVVHQLSSLSILRTVANVVNFADNENFTANFDANEANDTLRELNWNEKKAKEVVKLMRKMTERGEPLSRERATLRIKKHGTAENALRAIDTEKSAYSPMFAHSVPPIEFHRYSTPLLTEDARSAPPVNPHSVCPYFSQNVATEEPIGMTMFTCSPKIITNDGEAWNEAILDFESEYQLISQALKKSRYDVEFRRCVLTKDSLFNVDSNIFHISGHGLPGQLIIEDGWGGMERLDRKAVTELKLSEISKLKLVFVCSCYSGEIGRLLVSCGVPHVVAVKDRSQVKDTRAIEFSKTFYSVLFNGATLQKAFTRACSRMKVNPEDDVFELLPHIVDDDLESNYHEKRLEDLFDVFKKIKPKHRFECVNSIPCSLEVTGGMGKSIIVGRSQTSRSIFDAIYALSLHRQLVVHSVAGQGRQDLAKLVAREMRRLQRPNCLDGVIMVEFPQTIQSIEEFCSHIIKALDMAHYYESRPVELDKLVESQSLKTLKQYLHHRKIMLVFTTPDVQQHDWFPCDNNKLAHEVSTLLLQLFRRPSGCTCIVISPESRELLHSLYDEPIQKKYLSSVHDLPVMFFDPIEAKEYLRKDDAIHEDDSLCREVESISNNVLAEKFPLAVSLLKKFSRLLWLGVPSEDLMYYLTFIKNNQLTRALNVLKHKPYFKDDGHDLKQWFEEVAQVRKYIDLYQIKEWQNFTEHGSRRRRNLSQMPTPKSPFDWADGILFQRLLDVFKQRESLADDDLAEYIILRFPADVTPQRASKFVTFVRKKRTKRGHRR